MKAKLLSEDEKTYQMHDGQAAFRVPKAGLSEAMHAKIRAMGAPQQLAGGGVAANQLDLISGSVADMPNAPAPLAALPVTAFSLPTIPGPSPEGVPPPQSFTGAELGLPGGLPPDAAVSMAPPSQFQPSGATPSMVQAADRGHQPIALGLTPAPPDANVIKPIAGLKPKADPNAPPPAAAPSAAGAPRGGVAMPSSNQAGFDAASKEGLNAAQAQTDAEVAGARAKAEGIAEMGRVMERTALERKGIEEQARQQTQGAMNRVQAAQDEINRIDTSVDPGRFWASRSTGDKVLGIIGLALGAIGAGNDGVNRAAGMLNQAIDRDIDAQKAEHDARMRKGQMRMEGAKSFYGMARDAAGDDLAAYNLSRAMALDSAANKAAQLEASTAEPMAKARLGAMRSQLLQQSAQQKATAGQTMFDNRIKAGHLGVEQAQAAAQAAKKEGPSADAIKTAGSVRERAQNIRTSLDQADSIIQKYGTFELTGPEQAKLNKALNDVATDMAKLKDPDSAARESEVEGELNNLGFKAGSLTTSNATARELIKNYRQSVDKREAEGLRVRGFAK